MSPLVTQLLYTFEMTLLFSLVTVGLYLSFRILRFPDLTAEGGFGLSALLGGVALVGSGSPWIGLLVSVGTGMATGVVTAVLTNLVKIPTILASILTMTMCFSVGLLVVGRPSVKLPDIWFLQRMFQKASPLSVSIGGTAMVVVLLISLLLLFMRSGGGFILRTRGENPDLARELRHSLLVWDIVGLAVANGIVGLAASMLSQRSGYASIDMGRGVAISALASIMLAEAVFPSQRLAVALISCIGGTLILQLVRLVGLNLGIPEGGLDLVTSLLVIGFCWLTQQRGTTGYNVLERIRM